METAIPVRTVLENYAKIWRFTAYRPRYFIPAGETPLRSYRSRRQAAGNTPARSNAKKARKTNIAKVRTDAVIGLKFENTVESADSIAYAPQIGVWDRQVETLLEGAAIILADGTFYTSDEMRSLGVSAGSAEDMGYLPQCQDRAAFFKNSKKRKQGLNSSLISTTPTRFCAIIPRKDRRSKTPGSKLPSTACTYRQAKLGKSLVIDVKSSRFLTAEQFVERLKKSAS